MEIKDVWRKMFMQCATVDDYNVWSVFFFFFFPVIYEIL